MDGGIAATHLWPCRERIIQTPQVVKASRRFALINDIYLSTSRVTGVE